MPNQAAFELCHALKNVWRERSSRPGSEKEDLAIGSLEATCVRLYPDAGTGSAFRFAIRTAYRNLGCELREMDGSELLAAAVRLDAAFRQRTAKRTHLCPLDLADALPQVTFGMSQVRAFGAEELAALADPNGVSRFRAGWWNNVKRLSRFQWLIVEETVEIAQDVSVRSLPMLSMPVFRDHAAIAPHKSKFPEVVENAIFALLLVPWEDHVAYLDLNWRPFRVPWVHTVTDDIFVNNAVLPEADTLTWESDFSWDAYGNEVENERPTSWLLKHKGLPELEMELKRPFWAQSTLARDARSTRRPVQHFLVRAFLEEDFDEFLAHLITIEAALGLTQDHDHKARPRFGSKNPGAVDRLKWRLGGLLHDDAASAVIFERLYKRRSDYIHGKRMDQVSGLERVEARRLARRCVSAVLDHVNSSGAVFSYDDFLHGLLLRGRRLLGLDAA